MATDDEGKKRNDLMRTDVMQRDSTLQTLILVIGNLAQVTLWALLFLALEEFQQFSEAFYHSAVNFATLGYGDVVMSAPHKLLGPLEAINGALMIGMSTAALMSAFQDALQKTARTQHR